MKKTIFTFSAIAIVCGAIFFACKKDDNSATHVGYASQLGTNVNPDPNHTNTTSGATTTGTTTTSGTTTSATTTPVVYSVTLTTGSGPVSSTVTSNCSGTAMYGNTSNSLIGSINISFPTAPTAGSYNVVSNNPVAGQVLVSYNGSNYASGGTVSIAVVGGKNVATFNSVTGTTPTSFTLTGGFGCP